MGIDVSALAQWSREHPRTNRMLVRRVRVVHPATGVDSRSLGDNPPRQVGTVGVRVPLPLLCRNHGRDARGLSRGVCVSILQIRIDDGSVEIHRTLQRGSGRILHPTAFRRLGGPDIHAVIPHGWCPHGSMGAAPTPQDFGADARAQRSAHPFNHHHRRALRGGSPGDPRHVCRQRVDMASMGTGAFSSTASHSGGCAIALPPVIVVRWRELDLLPDRGYISYCVDRILPRPRGTDGRNRYQSLT